jgi:RNA polymerase sigma factor (TIGR02999 family)
MTDNVTEILARWSDGEPEAVERLLPVVYDELRRLARSYVAKERPGHTLQPTALVHEAYLRLADRVPPAWKDRVHFFAIVARIMRQVLVDHARRHTADKRGGDAVVVSIDDVRGTDQIADAAGTDLLLLDDALERLGELDPRKARIVELRFFGGLTIDECARVMELSAPTVVNETRKARAWLAKEILGGGGSGR